MRKLMWFTLGFSAACAAGVYLLSGIWYLLLAFVCLAAMVLLFSIGSLMGRKAAVALLGCVVGFVWLWCFDSIYLAPVRELDTSSRMLDIEVTDYNWTGQYGIVAEGKTELDGKTYTVQFYVNQDMTLSPGDRVEGNFRLRYTGGGAENPTFHRGKGIFLLCYPKGEIKAVANPRMLMRYLPVVWREKLLTLLDRLFPADAAPFAKALLIGDTSDLPFSDKWAMKTAGIYHVVAVSGMHVSILFALIYMLCGRKRWLTAVIGFPALLLFAAITGFSPSVVRACIMQALMILALLVNKEYDPPTALATAVLVILTVNPISITSASLQLSAGCMVGIFLFTQRIHDYLLGHTKLGPAKGDGIRAKLTRWAVASVSMTLGAMSLTTPLCAIYFGCVSLIGIVSNLLILWLVTLVFYGIMAACLLSIIWLPIARAVGWVIARPIYLILWGTEMISRLPVSAVYTSSIYIVAWLVFGYILLTVFLKTQKKHPVVLVCCLLAGLVVAIGLSWLEPRLDDYRITAVDVGQGQCLLLQNDGKYYMVDCGGESGDDAAGEAIKLLYSQGIFRLDGLVLTHYDADHAGGAMQLLSRVPTDTLYLPVFDEENELKAELSRQYADRVQWVREDISLDEAGITIYPSLDTRDANDRSLCVLFQPESCDILITGDRSTKGEQELLEHTQLPDLEILIAGHHGSKTSTSWELLDATRPELVIISVGAENRYGHPTYEALERMRLFGCDVFRTDLEGTIIFRG